MERVAINTFFKHYNIVQRRLEAEPGIQYEASQTIETDQKTLGKVREPNG